MRKLKNEEKNCTSVFSSNDRAYLILIQISEESVFRELFNSCVNYDIIMIEFAPTTTTENIGDKHFIGNLIHACTK